MERHGQELGPRPEPGVGRPRNRVLRIRSSWLRDELRDRRSRPNDLCLRRGSARRDRCVRDALTRRQDRLVDQRARRPLSLLSASCGAGDDIALVGVSAITPEENADFELPPGPQSVLIYVKRLDEPLLDSIAEAMQLEELRLVRELRSVDGRVGGSAVDRSGCHSARHARLAPPSAGLGVPALGHAVAGDRDRGDPAVHRASCCVTRARRPRPSRPARSAFATWPMPARTGFGRPIPICG